MSKEINDLRSFIERLDEEGELARIKVEVDWKHEIGAIGHKVFTPPVGPALLFEKVKGYNTPVFTGGLLTVRRIAIALGLDLGIDQSSLIKEFTRRLENPIKPIMLKDGPCKENKYFDKDVDVFKFPVPWWNEKDGGRYIGTWHHVVTKDLDSDWINVGTYRMEAHEPDLCTIFFAPYTHMGLMYAKYEKAGRPMPMAVAIGNDPVAIMVSAAPFPAGVYEWEMAGALRGKPFELVKAETVDLPVPARSEIVLEGEVLPEKHVEGPFGEHTGYYGGGVKSANIFKVKCITHRNNPIFRGQIKKRPVDEDHQVTAIGLSSQILLNYKQAGFPGVSAVSCPAGVDPWMATIVSIKKNYPSQALDAGRLLLSSKAGRFTKMVIIVDDDIDVSNLTEVFWAMIVRFQARKDLYITNESGSRLDPSVPEEMTGMTDKMIVDATWPTTPEFKPRPEWDGKTYPPEAKPSDKLRELVEKRWKEYGIKK